MEGRGGNEIWQNVISSPDVVLAVRGQKNGGVGSGRERRKRDLAKCDLVPRCRFGGSRTKKRGSGEGKGEEETRSGKYDCVGQILAHTSTAHARNLTCFQHGGLYYLSVHRLRFR